MEKTFAGGSKTVKFVNIFSLECFLLYSIDPNITGTGTHTWQESHTSEADLRPTYNCKPIHHHVNTLHSEALQVTEST